MNGSTKISLTIVLCAVIGVALLLPEEKSRSITSSIKLLLRNKPELCKEHHKSSFINPDSVYVLSSESDETSSGNLNVKVSAATRAGGRTTTDLICIFNLNGDLNEMDTRRAIEIKALDIHNKQNAAILKQTISKLQKSNDCAKAGGSQEACAGSSLVFKLSAISHTNVDMDELHKESARELGFDSWNGFKFLAH